MSKSIEELISTFDKKSLEPTIQETRHPVTFWISESYKKKYDMIQIKSRRRLGKLLTEIITQSIDRIAKDA
jgi:hypothetical protein